MLITLALGSLFVTQTPFALAYPGFDFKRDVVVSGDDAFALQEAKVIDTGHLRTLGSPPLLWSDDGKYLLICKEEMLSYGSAAVAMDTLELWNSERNSLSTLLDFTTDKARIHEFCWLHGTNTILAIVYRGTAEEPTPDVWSVLRIFPTGNMDTVYTTDLLGYGLHLETSLAAPLAFLQTYHPDSRGIQVSSYSLLTDNASKVVPLQTKDERGIVWFDKKGGPVFVGAAYGTEGVPPNPHYYNVDIETGALMPGPQGWTVQDRFAPPPSLIKPAVKTQSVSHGQTAAQLHTLWLEPNKESKLGDQSAAFVGVCDNEFSVSPTLNFVAYYYGNAVSVRQLAKVSARDYKLARADWEKHDAMNRARAIAKAIQLYCTDYDGSLPNGRGDVKSALMPYIRSEDAFHGFNYTFAGGSLADMQNLAGTLLGFMSTPYGRINVYADGHVAWASPPSGE